MHIDVFVINLPRDEQRRMDISAQLQSLHLPFSIFPAVDGKALSASELEKNYDKARAIRESHDLTPGEIGCALSHIGVYREMIRRNVGHALVLEDDARLSDTITDILPRLAARYPAGTAEIVMLNHVEKFTRSGIGKLSATHHVAHTYGGCKNSHGYFITQGAARKLVSALFPVWLVADRFERFKEKKFIGLKALIPYCIGLSEHAEISHLHTERVARMALYPRRGMAYYLHRFLYKKFLYAVFIRPFLRVAKQKNDW